MITAEYCVTFARYNAWQNKQLKAAFAELDETALREDRKAFFGSVFATANHILWGDLVWMSRFDGGPGPEVAAADHTAICASRQDWEIARFRADSRILTWAEGLSSIDLTGRLTWYSGLQKRDIEKSMALCVAGLFNHQTHHRGQIHAMLTAAGAKAPVTDLVLMPESGPWL